MADVRGGISTKRNTQWKKHEVYMQKIRLGYDEVVADDSVLGGAGTSSSPAECATVADQKFLAFYFKTAVTGKTITGLHVSLKCDTALSLFDTAITGAIDVPAGKNPRNPTAVQGEMVFTATGKPQGQASCVAAWVSLAGANFTGAVYGISSQITCNAGHTFAAPEDHEHASYFVEMSGDATAIAGFKNFLLIKGAGIGNKAAKKYLCNADVTGGGGASAGGIRIKANGTSYWLPIYSL